MFVNNYLIIVSWLSYSILSDVTDVTTATAFRAILSTRQGSFWPDSMDTTCYHGDFITCPSSTQ